MNKSTDYTPKQKSFAQQIYLTVWRWHFWAGLLIAPILVVMSITGAIYAFKPQIEGILYADILEVDPSIDASPSMDSFFRAAQAQHPEGRLTRIIRPEDPLIAWEGTLLIENPDGEKQYHRIFYDPYRDEVTGMVDSQKNFFAIVLKIHRTLFADKLGRVLTESATSWGIISVLSGLLLWWPKGKEKIMGVFIPRLTKNKRLLIRDLHAVPAAYMSIFLLLLMITGLLFTQVWGRGYLIINALTGGLPETFVNAPKSAVAPSSSQQFLELDSLYETANQVHDFQGGYVRLDLPKPASNETAIFKTDLKKPFSNHAQVWIDPYSGKVLASETRESLPMRTLLILFFYPIHTGLIFGIATQVLAALAAIILSAMSITGVWMWWRRRPQGELGAPRKPQDPAPRWLVIATISIALFLPTVAISLLLISMIGWVAGRFRSA